MTEATRRRVGLPRVRMGWRWLRYCVRRNQVLLHHPSGVWVWVSIGGPLTPSLGEEEGLNQGLRQAVRDRLRGLCWLSWEGTSDGRGIFRVIQPGVRYDIKAEVRGFTDSLEQVTAALEGCAS